MHSGKWTDRDQQNTKLVFVHVAASTARGPEYIDITELRSNTLKTRSDKEPRAKDKTFDTSQMPDFLYGIWKWDIFDFSFHSSNESKINFLKKQFKVSTKIITIIVYFMYLFSFTHALFHQNKSDWQVVVNAVFQ